jgi:hypothetical protein
MRTAIGEIAHPETFPAPTSDPLPRYKTHKTHIKPNSNTVFLTYLHTSYVSFILYIPHPEAFPADTTLPRYLHDTCYMLYVVCSM